jgi:hypothetical protein
MSISSQIAFLHEAIGVQRAALRFQKYLAMGVGFSGLFTIVAANLLAGGLVAENLRWLLTLGGTLFSSLSSFPVKEVFARRDRISAMEFMMREFERIQPKDDSDADQEFKQLKDRFWQYIEKVLVS